MNKSIIKIVSRLLIIILVLSLIEIFIPLKSLAAPAQNAASFISMTKNDSFNKEGKYYMSFNLKNIDANRTMGFYAKLVDSSGKLIWDWKKKEYQPGVGGKQNYSANYSTLPAGTYTFLLYCYVANGELSMWYAPEAHWKYTITTNGGAISFKDIDLVLNTDGSESYKFDISCINIKDKALTLQIFDESGNKVYSNTGSGRKTANEVGWFKWNGWPDNNGLKCSSGLYTVKVSFPGGTPIQMTFELEF